MIRLPSFDERRLTQLVGWSTVLVPLSIAVSFGALTGRGAGFYIGVSFLSLVPLLVGVNDLIFEITHSIDREQRRRVEEKRRAAIVAEQAERYRGQLVRMEFEELWLACVALAQNQQGVARSTGDVDVEALVAAGWVAPARGFSAFGFPYYFTDEAWVVLRALGPAVFAARDHAAMLRQVHREMPAYIPPPIVKSLEERLLELPGRLAVTVVAGIAGFFGIVLLGGAFQLVLGLALAIAIAVLIAAGMAIDEIASWLSRLVH